MSKILYTSTVGSLMFPTVCTRLDIAQRYWCCEQVSFQLKAGSLGGC